MPVMHSLSKLLLKYAQQMEDQHAPQDMTIALREAAAEIERLRAGGCARDQGLTQYCAEAARLAKENEWLRAALERIEANDRETRERKPLPSGRGVVTDPIWTRLRRVLDRSPDSTKVELSRASAEEMLHEIARLKAEVERLRAALEGK